MEMEDGETNLRLTPLPHPTEIACQKRNEMTSDWLIRTSAELPACLALVKWQLVQKQDYFWHHIPKNI